MTRPQSELEQKTAQRDRLHKALGERRAEFETMQTELKKKEQTVTALIATGDARKIDQAGELRQKLGHARELVVSHQETLRILEEELAKCETVLDELEVTEERDALGEMRDELFTKQTAFKESVLEYLLEARDRLTVLDGEVRNYQTRFASVTPHGDAKITRWMQAFHHVIKTGLETLQRKE